MGYETRHPICEDDGRLAVVRRLHIWDVACSLRCIGLYKLVLIVLAQAYSLGTRTSQADIDATTIHEVY